MTLREAYEHHHRVEHAHRPRTIEEYRGALRHWEREMGPIPCGEVTNATLAQFREQLLQHPRLGPVTVAKVLREIEAILATIGPPCKGNPYGLGLINQTPVVRKPQTPLREVVSASVAQVQAIYDACRGLPWPKWGGDVDQVWRCLVVYLFTIGSRRNEWLGLLWEDVDLTERSLRITPLKGGGNPVKPIARQLLSEMRPLADPRRQLWFPFPASSKYLYGVWHEIQRQAGIHVERQSGERRLPYFCFHELRATAATQAARISPSAAQALLGHRSLRTTEGHYINRTEIARDVVESLPRLSGEAAPTTPPQPPRQLRLFTG